MIGFLLFVERAQSFVDFRNLVGGIGRGYGGRQGLADARLKGKLRLVKCHTGDANDRRSGLRNRFFIFTA